MDQKTSLQTLSLQSIITSRLLWTSHSFISSLKHSPLNLAYPPRFCVHAIYTCSTNLSSSLLLPAIPHPVFCCLRKNNSGIKIGIFPKRSIIQTTVFQRRDQYDFNAEAREKKKPFCCNFTSKYRKYSYRNTKNQGGERGEIFLIALVLNNIGRVQKYNLWSWNNNPK